MLYLTPGLFRNMPMGYDLVANPKSDAELARLLSFASNTVNRYCAASKVPVPHDFRGGTISDEQHVWDLGNNYRTGSDRVYLYHTPVKAISQFTLRVTSDQIVNFQPADIYINNSDGYIEIISLARRLSVFSAGFVPVIGLRQPVAELYYTYGYSFSVTGEQFYPDDSLKIFRGESQWWDSTVPPNVYLNGALQLVSAYTVDYDEGTITFPAQVPSTTVVTVDYTHTLPNEIRDATAIIATNAAIAEQYVASGFVNVQGVRVEEAELRFRNQRGGQVNDIFDNVVDGRAQSLLNTYRFRSWGGA